MKKPSMHIYDENDDSIGIQLNIDKIFGFKKKKYNFIDKKKHIDDAKKSFDKYWSHYLKGGADFE